MSGFPKNLQYITKRISNYSRATKRLSTLNSTSATNNGVITVDLPSNILVDLDSLIMSFKAITNTGGMPRNIESLIQRCDLEINGQVIGGFSNYNQLFNIIADTSFGADCSNKRKIVQSGGDGSATPISTPTAYCICNWLTLNSFQPSILDTKLLGQVRLRIQLDGSNCLIGGGSFTLSDISFSVDTISIDDGLFDAAHNAFLQNGGVYEIMFKNYFSFSSAATSYSQSTKFSVSSQSVNRAWGMFVDQSPTGALDTVTKNCNTFVRKATGMESAQFNINGNYYPDFRASVGQCFTLTQSSYNQLQDVLGGIHPNCDSFSSWRDKFFVLSCKFCHNDDEFMSGIDTRGNSSIGAFESQSISGAAGSANLTAMVFIECSSMIRVGAGRQLELIL